MKNLTITEKYLNLLKKHLEFLCEEKLHSIEFIGGCVYVFGSELACLRLEKKYKNPDQCYQGFSKNRNLHFFVITNILEDC